MMFKHKFRILSLVLTLAMGLGLAACDGGNGGNSDTNDTSGAEQTAQTHYVAVCDVLTESIIVYDLDVEDWENNPEAEIWRLPAHRAADYKLRDNDYWGGLVVVSTGRHGAAVIDYETKQELWSTSSTPTNPHSIELLPNGNVVVAGSDGNAIRIYAANQENSAYYRDYDHPDAHGLLWDPEREVLWVWGARYLRAYSLSGTDEAPTLTLVEGLGGELPAGGGHDLAPVYGDTNLLWCTSTTGGAYQFDKTTGTFSNKYGGSGVIGSLANVKGVGNWTDGTVVYSYPSSEGDTTESWLTHSVNFFVLNEKGTRPERSGVRTHTTEEYYKVRVWCSDYQ